MSEPVVDGEVVEEGGTVIINLDELAAGFTADEQAEYDAALAKELEGIDFSEYRPPSVSVVQAYVVLCPAQTCGLVAARDHKRAALTFAQNHKAKHLEANKKAAALLKRFREQGAVFAPGRVGPGEVEIKSLDQLDRTAQEEPQTLQDNGYLDWQFGSEASGRDPEKMWHRKCRGEVVIINATRVCSKCGRADTQDGRVPILEWAEDEGEVTTTREFGDAG